MTNPPNTRKRRRPSHSKSRRATRPAGGNASRGKSTQQANTPVRAGTKQAKLIDMLKRADGASIAQMGAKTGWQPHSVRAALTGLRKRGAAIHAASRTGFRKRRWADYHPGSRNSSIG